MSKKNESVDLNPANGEVVGTVSNSNLAEFPKMMEKARAAQIIWAGYSYKQRAKHIRKMRQYIVENADELASIISQSNGKTLIDAMAAEVLPCALSCDWYPKNAPKVLKPKMRKTGSLMFAQKRTRMEYLPLGVVGIISPWNYPLSIPFGEVIMGLTCGNAVILKVADATTQVGVAIEKIIKAGNLPEGLFQMLYARGSESSNAMLTNGIDKLFFTGSVPAGKSIMAAAAQTLTPVSLELGGNDPAIILNDADVERSTNGIVWGAFQNNGQSCAGIERLYVQEGIYDEFMTALKAKVNALTVGEPQSDHTTTVGAMTTANQRDATKAHLDDALKHGATIAAQSSYAGEPHAEGVYHPSIVLENCTDEMVTVREETFGPLLAVMKFKTIDEVVEKANDSDLALSSSVWTKNTKLGRQLASRLQTGVTTLNDHLLTQGMAEVPWGGWKESGIGRTHGHEGLMEMVNEKAVNWDIMNAPRNLWWYPHDQATYDALRSSLYFVFPQSLGSWIKHTSKLLPFMIKKTMSKTK